MRPPAVNRPIVLLLGVSLAALGLGLGEWRWELLSEHPRRRLATDRVLDVIDADWFGWAAGAAGLVLVLCSLWWLLAHLPRPPARRLKLSGSDRTGRLEVDVASIAPHLATGLEHMAPVDGVTAQRLRNRRGQLVRLRAHTDPRADAQSIHAAVDALRAQLADAFPDGGVDIQILLNRPRRPSRRHTPRVH